MKRSYRIWAGALLALSCAFEFTIVKRFASNIAEGDGAYVGSLIVEVVFILALLAAAALVVMDKSRRGAAVCLCVASGVALYKTVTYVAGIMGNAMLAPLVAGKIIEISEIVFFAAPVAVMLLTGDKLSPRAAKGFLFCPIIAFMVGIGGRLIYFVGYGKSLFYDISLLFQVYGLDMAKTAVYLLAFGAVALSLLPAKIKKRR